MECACCSSLQTTFKLMRREWLHLEMALCALQTQHADAIPSLPVNATVQDKLVQLYREEKAIRRSLAMRSTAARWIEFFRMQLPPEEQASASVPPTSLDSKEREGGPFFPTSSSDWGALVESAAGLSVCMPFIPPRFRFSWD